jgi:hypothetical protein
MKLNFLIAAGLATLLHASPLDQVVINFAAPVVAPAAVPDATTPNDLAGAALTTTMGKLTRSEQW